MEKSAFFVGFEKKAQWDNTDSALAVGGAGALGGGLYSSTGARKQRRGDKINRTLKLKDKPIRRAAAYSAETKRLGKKIENYKNVGVKTTSLIKEHGQRTQRGIKIRNTGFDRAKKLEGMASK